MSSPAPSVEFNLPARRGIGTVSRAVATLAFASLLAWWCGAAPDVSESIRFMLGAAATASLVPALLCSRRDPPCRLRHDGEEWWWSGPARGEQRTVQGRVHVAFDLQSAMLLRFVVASSGRLPHVRWLAVRRSDLAPRWHEWRCAVVGTTSTSGRVSPLGRIETSG